MPKRAQFYLGVVILGGLLIAIGTWLIHPSTDWSPWIFVVLALLAAFVNTSKFLGPSYESWRINPVFLFAGLLTLPFHFYVILAVIPVAMDALSDWWRYGRTNRSWYMYPFHGAIYIIAGAVALWAYGLLVGESKALTSAGGLAGAILAAFIYVLIDRLLINQALSLFQFTSWQTYNLLDWVDSETFFTDLTFPILGFVVAVLIEINLWLILPALILIMLINRSATVPQLRKEAQTDPKTGLFNARYWRTLVFAELERARRFKRPLSLIMADLDLLRTINNVYGHLAGDVVLRGIAD
ncbi:MAG: diguanylate cyclase, partial [Caldilineaceae bacterium]|nr:diguanylate cyclase [Caldilineaceae bacterium]